MKLLLLLPSLLFAAHCLAQPKRDTTQLSRIAPFPDKLTTRLLTLYIQLPFARWPALRRNPFTASHGLVFIELYASNGRDSFSQFLAFRPTSTTAALFSNRPVTATFTDESFQFYHASLRVPLTQEQWAEVLSNIHQWARFVPYRRDSCNSVTFAGQLLRDLQPHLPGIYPPECHTPGQLYQWLQTLHIDVDRNYLYTDRKKRYAGVSYTSEQSLLLPHSTIARHE